MTCTGPRGPQQQQQQREHLPLWLGLAECQILRTCTASAVQPSRQRASAAGHRYYHSRTPSTPPGPVATRDARLARQTWLCARAMRASPLAADYASAPRVVVAVVRRRCLRLLEMPGVVQSACPAWWPSTYRAFFFLLCFVLFCFHHAQPETTTDHGEPGLSQDRGREREFALPPKGPRRV